jgi:hypothetical protein
MTRLFVRHKVADFAAWKRGYDGFDATRKKLGVRAAAVFRGAVDAAVVTIWHDFDTLAAAQAFVKSAELAAAMKHAGVVGEPQVWFVARDLG